MLTTGLLKVTLLLTTSPGSIDCQILFPNLNLDVISPRFTESLNQILNGLHQSSYLAHQAALNGARVIYTGLPGINYGVAQVTRPGTALGSVGSSAFASSSGAGSEPSDLRLRPGSGSSFSSSVGGWPTFVSNTYRPGSGFSSISSSNGGIGSTFVSNSYRPGVSSSSAFVSSGASGSAYPAAVSSENDLRLRPSVVSSSVNSGIGSAFAPANSYRPNPTFSSVQSVNSGGIGSTYVSNNAPGSVSSFASSSSSSYPPNNSGNDLRFRPSLASSSVNSGTGSAFSPSNSYRPNPAFSSVQSVSSGGTGSTYFSNNSPGSASAFVSSSSSSNHFPSAGNRLAAPVNNAINTDNTGTLRIQVANPAKFAYASANSLPGSYISYGSPGTFHHAGTDQHGNKFAIASSSSSSK